MKGYFSQLAKQSALRYAKGNTASPAPNEAKKAEKQAPLERNEFLLVSPVAAKTETPAPVEKLSPQTRDSIAKDSAEFSETDTSKPPATAEKNDAIKQENIFPAKEQSEASFEPENIEPEKSDSQKSPAAEQVVFKESETAEAEIIKAESAETSNLQNFYPPEMRDESEVEAAEETGAKPEFFNKTAEILESETADKLEVQKILLQEINEWVNAAPALSETEVQPIFKPVERESFGERRAAEKSSESPEDLQEQSFNLSIGTITVVVEEANNQPSVAATNQSRVVEKSAPEKRGFSRLGRHYL